jgi:lactoylglutathione lyase
MLRAISIDHINMAVKSLDESVEFYGELFGFKVRKEQPEQDSKIIGNDSIKLCLYENPGAVKHGGIAHFGFAIDNFEDVVAKCEGMGVEMPYGVIEWEESRSVYIRDLNRYEIELSEQQGGGL